MITHVPQEKTKAVLARLATASIILDGYADCEGNDPEIKTDMRELSESLRTCMVLLVGKEQADGLLRRFNEAIAAQMKEGDA